MGEDICKMQNLSGVGRTLSCTCYHLLQQTSSLAVGGIKQGGKLMGE